MAPQRLCAQVFDDLAADVHMVSAGMELDTLVNVVPQVQAMELGLQIGLQAGHLNFAMPVGKPKEMQQLRIYVLPSGV